MMVFAPLGTAVLPLAATRPSVSVTAQFSVSALGALVLKTSWKALPDAKMRVLSALGVSAEIVALPEPPDVAGEAQLMAAVPPAAFSAAVPVLALPAADVLAELLEPVAPAWAAAVLAAPLLPPPPPHPASARESVESRSSRDFINL
ncbi:hypothetical protein ACFQLY_12210 [Paraburkholderia dipogonis]|uniref:hypothetical protein n=1 Tax=Paraburkholderia dipogonis TaxID=1211383 RepID=UPI001FCC386B|nr:hypothetical protein [Paraburkholderia dipogonis]